MKKFLGFTFLFCCGIITAQENPNLNPVQTDTDLKVAELIQKKAEYHRLTDGTQNGFRIKIHFGADRDAAEKVRTEFGSKFQNTQTYFDYQQPYFVVMVGDFRTKLEACDYLRQVQVEYPNAFIVKGKINTK